MQGNQGHVAVEAAVRSRLNRYGWRSVITTVVGVGLLVLFVVMAARIGEADQRLLQTGARTPGRVLSLGYGGNLDRRGQVASFTVAYRAAGTDRTGTITLDSESPAYHVGESVTVVYDRSDPTRIRTTTEVNDSAGGTAVWIFALVIGVGLAALGVASLIRWRRMAFVVGQGSWRPVPVLVGAATTAVISNRVVVVLDESTPTPRLAMLGGLWAPVRAYEATRAINEGLLVAEAAGRAVVTRPNGQMVQTLRLAVSGRRRARAEAVYRHARAKAAPVEPA